MRSKRWFVFAALIIGLCVAAGLHAQTATPSATTTLLPEESGDAVSPDGFLLQENPGKEGTLQFDLSGLPPGLQDSDFIRCTLRLVAREVVANAGQKYTGAKQVIVKGRLPGAGTPSIVSLSVVQSDQPIALQSNEALRKAVYDRYIAKDKIFSIVLFTETHKASSIFHSRKSVADEFSSIPRLVIEYKLPLPSLLQTLSWPQPQHDPEHTGRTLWAPFVLPSGFTIEQVNLPAISGGAGTVVDYPLVYQGNIYIIYKNSMNHLVCLDFSGKNKLWEADMGTGTVQRSPVISPNGFLYAVTEDKIAAYDLNRAGQAVASYPLPGKLTAYTDLTAGNDGSIFLALDEKGVNHMLGFTPKLAPFIRSSPFDKRISTITASAGGEKIFAETPKGAAVIDIANPLLRPPLPLQGWEYYHVPVAGTPGGVMLFSDFTSTADKGNIWSYAATELWNASGTLTPQPVLGANGLLYFIQEGKLQGRKYDGRGPAEVAAGEGLKTTSNLVVDGANNIYFWSNGVVQGYKPDGSPLFPPKTPFPSEVKDRQDEGPEKFLRLLMAPDGTLWVNNKNASTLFALKPSYTQPDLAVGPADIRTLTVYRSTGTLRMLPDVAVVAGASESPTQILLEAEKGISFAGGFRVEKGASVLCRTGF